MRSPSRIAALLLATSPMMWAGTPWPDAAATAQFQQQIQPVLKEYCLNCHSTEKQKGDLDLEQFTSLEIIRKEPAIWQRVWEQLADGEMPPKNKPQPPAPVQAALHGWVTALVDQLASERAGDPGPVVLRRLSNAEYTYTIRDLTGLDSLEPAREFPIDGAAGEGFTNTGQALVMSPALITKYLDAAKEIASHAVLLPDGIRFSPAKSRRDWTEELLAQIREVYSRYTVAGGTEQVNLQGLKFESKSTGHLPLEQYLRVIIEQRESLRAGTTSIEAIAKKHHLSAKYLGTLQQELTREDGSLLMSGIRARLRTAKLEEVPALVAEIAAWQKVLWKFGSVGHIGKVGGPRAWMEPVSPVAADGSPESKLLEADFAKLRELFPAALCYTKIVPTDEVVTLILFHREDESLCRLMLNDEEKARLDRLWAELRYVSQDALTLVDAFAQLWEYATQDADPKVFEPLRKPIHERAAAFKQQLVESEPRHLEAVLEIANRAYRHPLSETEKGELRSLYAKLRAESLPHEEAIRLTLARVLVSPAFLYRAEEPGSGREQQPVKEWELATRLSSFLWSSMPDRELREAADRHELRAGEHLQQQTARMLKDERVRRLALEFACQWLHIRDFDTLDEKSERQFPTFPLVRGAMFEEAVRFFTDLFQNDGSVLDLLDSDHTFVNETLAQHYGIPGVSGDEWRRIDGAKRLGRGGILGLGATLAKQSGASRTSPILRGNWIAEALLGEKLPRPPKDVPQLPPDDGSDTLTVRQMVEQHTSDARCAGCHRRIDGFGFALEQFDAIGRRRERDGSNRLLDTSATLPDGTAVEGLEGLRAYLLTQKRETFVRHFCRKLLGYALGRSVQLSDEPLLKQMRQELAANQWRVSVAIQTIIASRQFQDIRGREMKLDD